MREQRQPKVYAVHRRRFTTGAMRALRFVSDGFRMVKLCACRSLLAEASSLDGVRVVASPPARAPLEVMRPCSSFKS